MKLQVRRTIVYEGDVKWVETTLAKSLALDGRVLDCGMGRIRVDSESRFPLSDEEYEMHKTVASTKGRKEL